MAELISVAEDQLCAIAQNAEYEAGFALPRQVVPGDQPQLKSRDGLSVETSFPTSKYSPERLTIISEDHSRRRPNMDPQRFTGLPARARRARDLSARPRCARDLVASPRDARNLLRDSIYGRQPPPQSSDSTRASSPIYAWHEDHEQDPEVRTYDPEDQIYSSMAEQSESNQIIFEEMVESPPFMRIHEVPHWAGNEPRTPKVEPEPSIKRQAEESPETALSHTPLSEASSVESEKYIGERKRQIVDRVVLLFTSWLRSRFVLAHQAAGESSKAPPPGGTYSAPQGQLSSPNDPNKARKGKAGDYGPGDDDEDDPEQGSRQTRARNAQGNKVECPRLACPYFKYNPARYQAWRGCPGPGWLDVHRVKYVSIHYVPLKFGGIH